MKKLLIIVSLAVAVFSACNNDYLIDGGVANPNVNLTTYDFLKTNPIFDTVVMLIDKAGLKDKVNGAVTFMAPTDFAVQNYVNDILSDMRVTDPNAKFTVDDIPIDTLMQLQAYMITELLPREKLTQNGKEYSAVNGEKRKISLEPRDEYSEYLSEKPLYVFFYKKKGTRWDDYAEENLDTDERDISVLVRTSGIVTNNGLVHVLQGNHVLFFYEKIY